MGNPEQKEIVLKAHAYREHVFKLLFMAQFNQDTQEEKTVPVPVKAPEPAPVRRRDGKPVYQKPQEPQPVRKLAPKQLKPVLLSPDQLDTYFEEILSDEEYPSEVQLTEEDVKAIIYRYEMAFANIEKADKVLNEYSAGWKTWRMNKVDLSILRMAVFELQYDPAEETTPVGIIIDEAVNLAKIYGGDSSYAFVNSILGKIVRGDKETGTDKPTRRKSTAKVILQSSGKKNK